MASSPAMTYNSAGNIQNAQTIAASATQTSGTQDFSAKFGAEVQVDVLTGGTAQAAGTYTVKVFRVFNTTVDNVACIQYSVSMGTAATHYICSFVIPDPGKYQITVTNGDTANSITDTVTSATIDSVG